MPATKHARGSGVIVPHDVVPAPPLPASTGFPSGPSCTHVPETHDN
jgi:hypothetical protein